LTVCLTIATISESDNSKIAKKTGEFAFSSKEIFFSLWPNGFENNPLFGQLGHEKEQRYFVQCNNPSCKKGGHHTSSQSKTAYGNAVLHATKCYGKDDLHAYVISVRTAKASELSGSPSKQQDLFTAFKIKPNNQDQSLHNWMKLVTLHKIPLTKIKDKDFCSLIKCEEISYKVFVDTMLELSMIVEEKIAAELKGKRGTIIHDGWSKFSKHYVCLLACYMIDTGSKGADGVMMSEAQMTLLACTTLPHVEASKKGTEAEEGGGLMLVSNATKRWTPMNLSPQNCSLSSVVQLQKVEVTALQ
jgi:hypothetical protein